MLAEVFSKRTGLRILDLEAKIHGSFSRTVFAAEENQLDH